MIEWMALMIWIGGLFPSFRYWRSRGRNLLWSALWAGAWPADLGVWVGNKIYDQKETYE